MSTIKAIDEHSIHRITSGQVVIDLQTAVKELVENSLDAGATSIEIRFKEFGLTSIEVVDNGTGISTEDHDSIALKHHTSKLSSFSELTNIYTFGFRGEALSSLCALSGGISVITATATQAPRAVSLDLERSGRVKSKTTIARPRGTTIVVKDLFSPLPVRRQELHRTIKREFAKTLNLLHAYALVPCISGSGDKGGKGVRFTVTNQSDKGKKSTLIKTDGTQSLRSRVLALWGSKSLEGVNDFRVEFEVDMPLHQAHKPKPKGVESDVDDCQLKSLALSAYGLLSGLSSTGRLATDRQIFYVNGRPCNLPKVQKLINEMYRQANPSQSPFVVLDLRIPLDAGLVDVNVTPDKRTIFLAGEAEVMRCLAAEFAAWMEKEGAQMQTGGSTQKGSDVSSDPILRSTQAKRKMPSEEPSVENPIPLDSPKDSRMSPTTGMDVSSELADLSRPNATEEGGTDDEPSSEIATNVTSSQSQALIIGEERIIRDNEMEIPGRDSPEPLFLPDYDNIQDESTLQNFPIKEESSSDVDELSVEPSYLPSRAGKYASKPVQMVLSTSGASWNLRARSHGQNDGRSEPPRKKAKVATDSAAGLKKLLSRFRSDASDTVDHDASGQSESLHITAEDDCEQDSPCEPESYEEASEDWNVRNTDDPVGSCHEIRVSADESMQKGDIPTPEEPIDTSDHEPDCEPVTVSANDRIVDPKAGLTTAADDPATTGFPVIASDSKNSTPPCAVIAEIVRSSDSGYITVHCDILKITSAWSQLLSKPQKLHLPISKSNDVLVKTASTANVEDNEKAAEALSRIIEKDDFKDMDIIGQFNLGFIIARRRVVPKVEGHSLLDDLFIVDQHAADEKYNFETLQQTTVIESQQLFRSRTLELTAADELLALGNVNVLKQNGFQVDVDEDAAPGQRLKLVAHPVSKNTVFDMKDLEELLHLMQDRPAGQMVRCSKTRAMFAMRACRKSVMVGMPLTKVQMTSVVRHMGTLDQPWNCPHGRPTMRHLCDIAQDSLPGRCKRQVDWTRLPVP